MKSLCIFFAIVAVTMLAACPVVLADPITNSTGLQVIHISYNSYGVAYRQQSDGTSTLTTRGDLYLDAQGNVLTKVTEDGKEKYVRAGDDGKPVEATLAKTIKNGLTQTTTTRQVTTLEWTASGLKIKRVKSDSVTKASYDKDGDGIADGEPVTVSESDPTDIYTYDANGVMTGATGTGTYKQYTTIGTGPNQVTYESGRGTITRTYDVKDGQARLLISEQIGDLFDKAGKDIGDSSSTDTNSNWQYIAGEWVSGRTDSVNISVNHEASATLVKADITKPGGDIKISSVEKVSSFTISTRNDAGVPTTLGKQYKTGRDNTYRITYTSDPKTGGMSSQLSLIELAPGHDTWVETKVDPVRGIYISDEWFAWRQD